MSGGHWNYSGYKLREILQQIADDDDVRRRWPRVSVLCEEFGEVLETAEHEMDWDLSGDSGVGNDAQFQKQVLDDARDAVERAFDSPLTPRPAVDPQE